MTTPTPIASGSKPRLTAGEQGRRSEDKGLDSGLNKQTVQDLVEHFFSNPPRATSLHSLSLVSPHLTIALPYYPIDPPCRSDLAFTGVARPERSISAKALALFHLPTLAVSSLPRSSWTLAVSNVSRVSECTTPVDLITSLKLDPNLTKNVEIWTAELQWTLRFGSIATTDGISAPSLSYQAGKPIGLGGGYDDWVSVGDKRTVEMVFTKVDAEVASGVSNTLTRGAQVDGKGKGKERVREVDAAVSQATRLVHIRLSSPPGATTPSDLLSIFVPPVLQPLVAFVTSHVVAPLFVSIAFVFLRYLHLDTASSRFLILPLRQSTPPRRSQVIKEDEDVVVSSPKSPQRSRSRTRRPLTGRTPLHPLPSRPSDTPSSTVHVEVPIAKPTREEVEALEILRRRASSSPVSPRRLSSEPTPAPPRSLDIPSHRTALVSVPLMVVSALILETSDLYYLIARIVVLFTQVVVACGGILKEVLVSEEVTPAGGLRVGGSGTAERENARVREGEARSERIGRERLGRISETDEGEVSGELDATEVVTAHDGRQVRAATPISDTVKDAGPLGIDDKAIARGSPPLSPTPPVYHHPRLRGKRVQFPQLFATVIGQSESSPQVSLPPSPSHSPAPPPLPVPATPPPSLSSSPEYTLASPARTAKDADSDDEYSTDPRMFDLPKLATAETEQAVLHFRVAHEAAARGRAHRSSLSLPNHGVDAGGVGARELRVWDAVAKEASEVGRSLSEEVRTQVAVEDTEEELVRKREEFIEENWERDPGEEGEFETADVKLERKRLKNLVGKEASRVAVEKMGDEGEREQLEAIEGRVEEKREKLIEEAIERETASREGGALTAEEAQEEEREASRPCHSAVSPSPSPSDYPTPSSRRADQPLPPGGASSFEPASPPASTSSRSSSSSTVTGIVASPSCIASRPSGLTRPSAGSPPSSPEVSMVPSTVTSREGSRRGTVDRGGETHSAESVTGDGARAAEAVAGEEAKSDRKSKRKKGRK
ncbi:hypothetical protein JCM11491_005232 [Sporobolomyces phaffii]